MATRQVATLICRTQLFSTSRRKFLTPPVTTACKHFKQNVDNSGLELNKHASVVVSRMTMPDDANPLGIIHGGVILNMAEEAGVIVSTKYVNANKTQDQPESSAALVRVERMVFKQPVYVGEVVNLEAELIYTSPRSLLVQVDVYAENIYKDKKRLTNRAKLWYVAVNTKKIPEVIDVPQMEYRSKGEEEEGRQAYLNAKRDRTCAIVSPPTQHHLTPAEPHTVAASQSHMLQLVHPSSCIGNFKYSRGGFIMKWMDECAGLVASKHCKTFLVTLSMDATNFHYMCAQGTSLSMVSRVTFTSACTIEVQCVVDAEYHFLGIPSARAAEAYFTFVTFDKNRNILKVPQLKIQTKDEEARFNGGLRRYENRKRIASP